LLSLDLPGGLWGTVTNLSARPGADLSGPTIVDIAKNVFQVHGIDAAEKVILRKQLRRGQVKAFFEALGPCLVGMEARATSHHRARE
jgi:hypothetical protein